MAHVVNGVTHNVVKIKKTYAMSMGSVTNHSEWRWIMRNNMLIGRDNHYYVRKGGMVQDYEVAFGRALDQATKDISNILWPNGGPSDDQDQSEGRYYNNGAEGGDEVIIVEKQRRGRSKLSLAEKTA